MFVFNYERPYPERETDPRRVFTVLFTAGAAVALSPWLLDRAGQAWSLLRALPRKAGRAALRAAWRERRSSCPTRSRAPTARRTRR